MSVDCISVGPLIKITGVGKAFISSLNVAVIVTIDDPESKLSSSVSVKITVGGVLSTIKVILSVPVYTFPAISVPETVAVYSPSAAYLLHQHPNCVASIL